MSILKFALLIILSKIGLLFWSGVVGTTIGYFLESYQAGIASFFATAAVVYWRYVGPMHYAVKTHIKELVDSDIIVDTTINPHCHDLGVLKLDTKGWFSGEGLMDVFLDMYRTQGSKKGVYFYAANIPYLPIYFLPWSNVLNVTKATPLVKKSNVMDENITFELCLKNKDKILLPLSNDVYQSWENVGENIIKGSESERSPQILQ